MMKWKFIAAAAALMAAGSPAFAADLAMTQVEPVAPLVIYNWSGFYVGADIGYAWASADAHADGPFTGSIDLSPDADGVVGGVYVGYNAQFNQLVVGIEADIEATGNSGDDRFSDVFDLRASADQNWQGSVRAPLGWAIDNFMPYVTAGVAFSDWDVDSNVSDPILGDFNFSDSKTFTGWTIGVGLDYGFTQNIIGRIEYRYTDFGDADFHNDIAGVEFDSDASVNTSTIRVGVAYKF